MKLPGTDYFITASKGSSSLSVWTARAGLTKVGMIDFKLQSLIDPKEKMERA
jgi:hypothetical protein